MAKAKKSKKKLFIFGGLGLLLVVVVLLLAFQGNSENIIGVQTENAERRTLTQVVSATGKINPEDQVVITPEVNGEIVGLPVEEGNKVDKGQLLIRIRPEVYQAQRDRARASLESAKANLKVRKANLDQVESEYKRIQELYEKELASESQLEAAKASYLQNEGMYEAQKSAVLQAEEALKEAEENLAKTSIYSPLNGTISQLNVELGERVLGSNFTQGTNIMTVADLNSMEATVEVDENDVVLISVGDTASVEVDAFPDKKFRGVVSQIGNSAQSTGLGTQNEVVNFEVKIRLVDIDERIRPGMSCDADIMTETKVNVISVPIQSVTARMIENKNDGKDEEQKNKLNEKNEPQEVVFKIKDNRAFQVPVKIGITDDTHIEIIGGLEEGETIVSGPYRAVSKELSDSALVMVQKGGMNNETE